MGAYLNQFKKGVFRITTLIGWLTLISSFLWSCKSSKQLVASKIIDEKKDVIQTSNLELTKKGELFTDFVINTDKKLDFIVFDTSKLQTDSEPPVLIKGSFIENSVITDKSMQEELITDNSKIVIKNKDKVNIRNELKSKEKKNKSWIKQLVFLGNMTLFLLCIGVYIKKRWF